MKPRNARIIAEAPDGRVYRITVPPALAWAAARGIARETFYGVVLSGQYGTAQVRQDGSADVCWLGESLTSPTRYEPNATACIC